jgi:outer membrane protein with beta-barrel domain
VNTRVLASAITIVGVMCASPARAQGVVVGIKAGLNFATTSNAQVFPPATAPPLVGGSVESPRFSGGAFLVARFSNLLAFQPEGLYSMQGVNGIAAHVHSDAEIDMIQIPLLLRVGHKRGLYFIVGPAVGFVVRAIQHTNGLPDADFQTALNSQDTSLVLGGGLTVAHILVEGRYAAGLRDINKTAGSVVNKNKVFSILAGIQF